ncbi:MAG: acetate/propionate family kinase, partial [Candidatus Hodarchaeales archaeon]
MKILTLNCGSSSVKYSLFDVKEKLMVTKGIVERIGDQGSFIRYLTGKTEKKEKIVCENHEVAVKYILTLLSSSTKGVLKNINEVTAVAHRVVHGGESFTEPTLITKEVESLIDNLSFLAPLHNPPNLHGIQSAKQILPTIPHIAIFDTAFHQTLPEYAYRYAIPADWYIKKKYRKYGFHGTSVAYVSQRAQKMMGSKKSKSNLAILHLGNGASITAVKNGQSIDTSMGLTPLEGLIMGTRSGDIDPGVILAMLRSNDLSVNSIDKILNRKSGLLGITQTMSDMRDIEIKAMEGDQKSQLALKMTAYRIKKYLGAYYVILRGLDAIVFTAGIGEK